MNSSNPSSPLLEGSVIGCIGRGLMGRPMALNLHKAGARVVIHNRLRGVIDALAAEGLEPADSSGPPWHSRHPPAP